MKLQKWYTAAACCAGLMFTATLSAQPKAKEGSDYNVSNAVFSSNVMLNEINTRAFRHFYRSYHPTKPVEWTKQQDRISATVDDGNGVHETTNYDNKGRLLTHVVYYDHAPLPDEIAAMVKKQYPAYNIFQAFMRNDVTTTVWSINVEKGNTIKFLELENGNLTCRAEVQRQQ